MKKEKIIILLGFWITILTFLGFPTGIKQLLYILTSIGIIVLMFQIQNRKTTDNIDSSEMENMPPA